jgi:hypothetical protein
VRALDLRTLWSRVLQHHHHLREAFASRFGFLSNASERKPKIELLVWKHEKIATEKKRSWSYQFQSRSLFSSLFSSVLLLLFSRLQQRSAPPPGHAPPVLGIRERSCPHRPCWELDNSRARTARAGNQRTTVPVPPVQGTREPAGLLWRTWPDTPHGGPNRWKFENPGVPGQARSAFCDGLELRDRQTKELIYKISHAWGCGGLFHIKPIPIPSRIIMVYDPQEGRGNYLPIISSSSMLINEGPNARKGPHIRVLTWGQGIKPEW